MKNLLYTLIAMLALASCSKEEEVVIPPAPNKYTLTITADTGGSVSSPGGTYNEGSKITVTATPDGMYLFKEWSDGSTLNPREITVTSNLTLKASFIKKTYLLAVTVEGEGTVAEEVIVQGSTTETEYNAGTTVRLTATPNEGWVFAGWSGDVESEELVIEVPIEKGTSVSALFKRDSFELNITIEGEGTVKEEVIVQPGQHDYETVVRLTAIPADGWKFASWSGDVESEEVVVEVELTSEVNIAANFIPKVILPLVFIRSSGFPAGIEINWNDHRKSSTKPYYFNQDNIPDIITSSRPLGTSQDPEIVPSLVIYDYRGTKIIDYNIKEEFNPQMRDSLNNLNIDKGDFNSDGKVDLALSFMGEYDNDQERFYEGVNAYLMISNASGGYDVSEIIDAPNDIQFGITVLDVDQDGDLDVVNDMNNGQVYLNNGEGLFEKDSIQPLYISEGIHRMDWDKDGKDDLVNVGPHNKLITVVSSNGIQRIPFENTGWDFYFTVEGYSEEWNVERSAVLDADNDGDWDIVFGGFYNANQRQYNEFKYFENVGGQYQYREGFIEHNYSIRESNGKFFYNNMLEVWVEDLDGDGDPDLYHPTYGDWGEPGNEIESVFWWENTPEGFKMNFNFRLADWNEY